jgi:ketosteroid isomerase-like protein
MNNVLEQLFTTDREFAKLSADKGAETAFAEYLTSDATQLSQGQIPIVGASNISQAMAMGPGESLVWTPENGMVAKSGDLGFTWGFYKVIKDQQVLFEGKYLNIWIKQPDGRWKVAVDMGNTNK